MDWNPATYAKAIIGAVLAGLGTAQVAVQDDIINTQEWIGISIAVLTVFAGVFGLPNKNSNTATATVSVDVATTPTPNTDKAVG